MTSARDHGTQRTNFGVNPPLNPATLWAPGASEPSWCGRRTNVPRSWIGASRRCERAQRRPAMPRSLCRLPQRVRVLTCQSWSFSRLPGDRGQDARVARYAGQIGSVSGMFNRAVFEWTVHADETVKLDLAAIADCSLRPHKLFPIRSLIEPHRRSHLTKQWRRSRKLRPALSQTWADSHQREMYDEEFYKCQHIPFSRVRCRRDRCRRHAAGVRPIPRSHRQHDAVLLRRDRCAKSGLMVEGRRSRGRQ